MCVSCVQAEEEIVEVLPKARLGRLQFIAVSVQMPHASRLACDFTAPMCHASGKLWTFPTSNSSASSAMACTYSERHGESQPAVSRVDDGWCVLPACRKGTCTATAVFPDTEALRDVLEYERDNSGQLFNLPWHYAEIALLLLDA